MHTHKHNCLHMYTHPYILVSPGDYTGVSMTLGPFTSQRPRQCFSISIINDTVLESNETFTARLTLIPASVTTITPDRIIVDPPETTVLITDNDLSKLIVVRVPSLKPRSLMCASVRAWMAEHETDNALSFSRAKMPNDITGSRV